MKKLFIKFVTCSTLVSFLALFGYLYSQIYVHVYKGPDKTFTIFEGESFSRINYHLKKGGFITNSSIFYHYSRIAGIMGKFKAGVYLIPSNSNMLKIIDILVKGDPQTISVTIPEGKNIFEIGKILAKKDIVKYKDFLYWAQNKDFLIKIGLSYDRAEGYLYPDTYKFPTKCSSKSIIKKMYGEFKKKTANLNLDEQKLSPHKIITLASIVEKETGAQFERPIIAGVFHNRLERKIRLQSDPTTIYGIYEKFDGNLKKKHLREKTPYNTYRISGLPFGPICNPGLKAILAVLNPKKHNYIYFVSRNDGTHMFSSTYREHLKRVKFYQKNRENRKGKSWRNLIQN